VNVLKWLVVIGVLGLTYQWWNEHEAARLVAVQAEASPNGFIPTTMPTEARPGTVLILAPMNCSRAAGKRADALADELDRMGIPAKRSDHFSVNVTAPTDEEQANLERLNTVVNGEIPAVFINGMGRSNPTADEVAAEYRRTQ
jgi:hypothetical protein